MSNFDTLDPWPLVGVRCGFSISSLLAEVDVI